MKHKFKVGDRVIRKNWYEGGVGRVTQIKETGNRFQHPIQVVWEHTIHPLHYFPDDLELLETPIQRMRRLYEES